MAEDRPPRLLGTPANAIHMIRTTQQAHYQLSQMADQKASILMAATFVIFTITIGQARNGALPPTPLLILGSFAFAAAALAVMAVLPANFGERGPINLLFFGSFVRFELEDYQERLLDAMATDETIYRTMATDIWQNGQVLARKKYRLLGYAYRALLAGLTLSLIAFLAPIVGVRV